MKNTRATAQSNHGFPEPSAGEIRLVQKQAKEKFDSILPKPDAIRLARLIRELGAWREADGTGATDNVSLEAAVELQGLLKQRGKDITLSESYEDMQVVLALVPHEEKRRITNQIRGVLVEHKRIPYDHTVEKKLAGLLLLQYEVTLNEEQLSQVVQLLARKLWYEEGLEASLEACLDDLLLIFEKQQRQVPDAHHAVQEALDWTVKQLARKDSKLL